MLNKIASKIATEPDFFNVVKNKFGDNELNWLKSQIKSFWGGVEEDMYEYPDNFRVALKDDQESEEKYEDAAREGCCGFVDKEFGPSPSGNTYLYGFNYGH
jgi:hypothetical protein